MPNNPLDSFGYTVLKMQEKFAGLKISQETEESSQNTVKRTPSTSSHYNTINADLHARVKAFQEQRALKRSSSVGSHKNLSDSEGKNSSPHGSGVNSPTASLNRDFTDSPSTEIQHIVNKPLPPLPKVDNTIPGPQGRTISANATGGKKKTSNQEPSSSEANVGDALNKTAVPQRELNPIRKAPRRPIGPLLNSLPTSNRPPSLSQRRGLKLPPGGLSLKMLPKKGNKNSEGADQQEFAPTPSNNIQADSNHLDINNGNGKRSNPGSLVIQSASISSSSQYQRDTEGTEPRSNVSSGSSGSGGLFANFSKYVDIKSGSLNFAGKLSLSSKGIDFSNGFSSRINLDEIELLEELGHGNYGNVSKVLHKPTNVIMAMKEVRLELDEAKFRQILMELEVLHKCNSPYIVDFYGAFFVEGAVYMCMEYMDGGSLDNIYGESEEIGGIDEPHLARITDAVIQGLKELKDVHNVIHRDVKPTNILCSMNQGTVKLCDFGVSGNLVASLAKTNIGCQSYMAPERIKSLNPDRVTYTVQSDIWSLGLSILEMALGRYPYPPETYDNIFSQLSAIVDGPPPKLPGDRFSDEARKFVELCLQKVPERRPSYASLLEHPWLVKYRSENVNMDDYITSRVNKRKQIILEKGEQALPKTLPALHMGGA